MTPEEKAKELIYRFYDIEKNDGYFDYPLFLFCQKCALIAVDEILEELLECGEVWMKSRIKYWQEVKQEIEKL
jgi:hypothetical protein